MRTYGPLAIVPTPAPSPNSGGRFADGDPAIAFSNPLDPEVGRRSGHDFAGAGIGEDLVTVPDDSNTIAIDPYALDPDATYSATVAGEREGRLRSNAWARAERHDSHLRLRAGRVGAERHDASSRRARRSR